MTSPTMNYAVPVPPVGMRAVLVVDDEPGIRAALTAHFAREGWRVTAAGSLREARFRLAQDEFDLLVSDVRLADGSGLELLPAAESTAAAMPVILLTAYGTVPDAVEAMRCGASDYLIKPVAWPALRSLAERVLAERITHPIAGSESEAAQELEPVKSLTASKVSFGAASGNSTQQEPHGIVGRAPALLFALARARAAAGTDADVLVEAESGTGKELLARFIHEASARAHKPFVAVNCAAVPEHLLESELFGHARGAFTGATQAKPGKFELAHGGTLLLDEIGEMPLHLQPKLLRALQEREFERLGETRTVRVDIRVIATTNVELAAAVRKGVFRSDLYYRLNVIPLSLPPLRERAEDIAQLAAHFARTWAERAGQPVPVLAPEFLELLALQPWPGNIRELANFMRRVLSLHAPERPLEPIDRECFLREAASSVIRELPLSLVTGPEPVQAPREAVPAGLPIRQLERMHLEKTLAMTHGNRTHAAEMLGISLRTMRNKIREYGLPPRRYA